jgi:outer membrane lipoprotein-sorting protein
MRGLVRRVALLAALSTRALAAPLETPPADLVTAKPADATTLAAVMKLLGVTRLAADFIEQKHSALLARPLVTKGTLVYERDHGLVRTVTGPRAQQIVVTQTALTIRKGAKTETVPLAKSKDLQAFALVFPALLRGDRDEIAKSFDLAVRGSDKDWWALTLTPKAASLKKLIASVVVIGRGREVRELRVVEASGDHSEMTLSAIRTNGDVADTELTGFASAGAP